MIPERGTILDSYKLLARVGAGSCGVVWQAENVISGEIEALKILSCNALAERELRALRLYREFEHRNLIRIRHVGKFEDTLFYTMDWCETSLAEKRVRSDELLDAARQLLSALALLHSKGLLHRDIKPANVFFRQGVPVLGDVGLLTTENGATIAGSPGFLSPALLSGKGSADRYSDVYALAKSLYCALSGFGPERFPSYKGELTEAASLLMRGIMLVCGNGSIDTAEKFLDFLNSAPPGKKSGKRRFIFAAASFVLPSAAGWGAYRFFHTDALPGKETEVGIGAVEKKETAENAASTPSAPAEVSASIKPAEESLPQQTEERKEAVMPVPAAQTAAAEKTAATATVPQTVPVMEDVGSSSNTAAAEQTKVRKDEYLDGQPIIKSYDAPFATAHLNEINPENYTPEERQKRKSAAKYMLITSLDEIFPSSFYDKTAEDGLTEEQLKVYKECKATIMAMQKQENWLRARKKMSLNGKNYYNLIIKAAREKKDPVRELQKAVKDDRVYALAVCARNACRSYEMIITAIIWSHDEDEEEISPSFLENFRRYTDEQVAAFSRLRPSDLE